MNKLFVNLVLALGASCAIAQSSGPINTPMLNKAYYFVGTSPYTTTIQSAATAACTAGAGAAVIVPPGVTPADSPTAVVGCSSVKMVVQTTLPWACYASTGGYYSATECGTGGGGGGSVTSVSSGNLSPLFTVTVNTATTTPAFVFSLNSAAEGTYFGCPVGGSSCTPAYQAISYQTVALNSTAQTQRPTLNFSSNFTASDSASPAQTTIDLANVGSAGTISDVCSVTTDSKGRVTAFTSSTPRTCNANGCYATACDGTVTEYGTTTIYASTCTGSPCVFNTASITFPLAFPTVTPIITLTSVGQAGTGDSTTPPAIQLLSSSQSSASVFAARTGVPGAGGSDWNEDVVLNWIAIGR